MADLADLAERTAEYGPVAYLVTVGADSRPHLVAVTVGWDGGDLIVGAGRHTSANAAAHPAVMLVWAAAPASGYCLIVDGTARLASGEGGPALAITPTGAVLHRTPDGDPAAPSCITVLAKPGSAGEPGEPGEPTG